MRWGLIRSRGVEDDIGEMGKMGKRDKRGRSEEAGG